MVSSLTLFYQIKPCITHIDNPIDMFLTLESYIFFYIKYIFNRSHVFRLIDNIRLINERFKIFYQKIIVTILLN